MQRSLFAAIAIAVAGLRAPSHIATLSQTIAAFQKDSFKEFLRQDAVPKDIALRIGKVLPFPLAEAGQPFNSGCTTERGRITRRFALVGVPHSDTTRVPARRTCAPSARPRLDSQWKHRAALPYRARRPCHAVARDILSARCERAGADCSTLVLTRMSLLDPSRTSAHRIWGCNLLAELLSRVRPRVR